MARTILIVELLMGVTLLAGMLLARARRFHAHGLCQSAVVLLNLVPIIAFMVPAFRSGIVPGLPGHLSDRFHAITTAHAVLGGIAEILGLYILLVAGTNLLPRALRFANYKRWMRAELLLWWLVIVFGVSTYWVWNVASATPVSGQPTVKVSASSETKPAKTVTVRISNFTFDPKDLQIESGTTVIWQNTTGHHSVTADDGSFDSPIMAPGEEFKRTFDQPGSIKYFCNLHGAAGGQKMAGTLTVSMRH